MKDIRFRPFGAQNFVLRSRARTLGIFAGKRGGKTEVGAVKSIKTHEEKPNFDPNTIDPYLGVVLAPTYDMLRDLSWKKFLLYAEPFIRKSWQSPKIVQWWDKSEVRGLSADKPERLEGKKVSWGWIDEIFQVKEQAFTEMQARVSDTLGYLFCTGSLGVQYVNPKQHWAYKYFKKTLDPQIAVFEWATKDNPYFPKEEIERLKRNLDARTFQAMFDLIWDVIAKNAVYSDWTELNEKTGLYDPSKPIYLAIDWGWTHPMVCLFIQYDEEYDTVRVVDEIYMSKLKVETLCEMIVDKKYNIRDGCCDIAGNQEREQTGLSNIRIFEKTMRELEAPIELWVSRAKVLPSISIVRRYVKNNADQIRLFVDPEKCPKTISSIKSYRYPERNGIILNENPVKEDDDGCDALRYFFINFIDDITDEPQEVRQQQNA